MLWPKSVEASAASVLQLVLASDHKRIPVDCASCTGVQTLTFKSVRLPLLVFLLIFALPLPNVLEPICTDTWAVIRSGRALGPTGAGRCVATCHLSFALAKTPLEQDNLTADV